MEPLLGNASRQRQHHEDTSDDDGLDIGRPGRNGAAGKRRDSGSQPKYQTINAQQNQGSRISADGSTIHRRSTASNHNRRRGTSVNATRQVDREADGRQTEGESDGNGLFAWVRATMAMFMSVELDNKGSVARDHLALGKMLRIYHFLARVDWYCYMLTQLSLVNRAYVLGMVADVRVFCFDRHSRHTTFPTQHIDQ